MNPTQRAKEDLSKLNKDLARTESQATALRDQIRRIEAYIEMSAIYETPGAETAEVSRTAGNGVAATSVRIAVEMIRERGKRIHTRELLEILADRGIEIGGSNPVANLSGFLSRSSELNNSRAEGWGLESWKVKHTAH